MRPPEVENLFFFHHKLRSDLKLALMLLSQSLIILTKPIRMLSQLVLDIGDTSRLYDLRSVYFRNTRKLVKEQNRNCPTSLLRRLNRTHASLDWHDPKSLGATLGMKTRSLTFMNILSSIKHEYNLNFDCVGFFVFKVYTYRPVGLTVAQFLQNHLRIQIVFFYNYGMSDWNTMQTCCNYEVTYISDSVWSCL